MAIPFEQCSSLCWRPLALDAWKVQNCFAMQLQALRVFHGLGGFQLESWSAVDGMKVSERSGLRWIALDASFWAV